MHRLDTTKRNPEVLDGFPTVSPAATSLVQQRGYVVLALIAERAAGSATTARAAARDQPAGPPTRLWRRDEPPGDHAIAYLHAAGLR